jgi:hypothetical protein
MTRLEALRGLYDAVKGGKFDATDTRPARFNAFANAVEAASDQIPILPAWDAYKGSVDAALALIAATLPGWRWSLWAIGGASIWNDVRRVFSVDHANPATALLLACIAALIAIEEGR